MKMLCRTLPSHRAATGARGQIMILFALMIVVILGLAGLAVDVTHARTTAEQVQQAADAAALAGVVYLPEAANSTVAEDTARSTAAANRFGNSSTTSVTVTAYGSLRRLRVSISTKVTTPFLNVIGRGSVTITRSATAAYSDPVDMGSNDHVIGVASYPTNAFNDAGAVTGVYPQGFYLQLKGPYGGLEHGDAFTPYFDTTESGTGEHQMPVPDSSLKNCTSSTTNCIVDPCTAAAAVGGTTPSYDNVCTLDVSGSTTANTTLVPNPYNNEENAGSGQNGYSYIFTLPPQMTHSVLLKALDPLDTCDLDTNHTLSPALYGPDDYKLASKQASTMNLSINPPSSGSGVLTTQLTNNATNADTSSQWQFFVPGSTVPVQPSSGTVYNVVNVYSHLYLTDPGGSVVVPRQLDQETLSASPTTQQWKLQAVGGDAGHYYLVNQASGKYLDNMGSTTSGAAVDQNTLVTPTSPSSQRWSLTLLTNTYSYAGVAANYDNTGGAFGDTTGWTANTGGDSNYAKIYAVIGGQSPTGLQSADPGAFVQQGSTNLDACDNMYNTSYHPTPLTFTVHDPSIRMADNTAVVQAGATDTGGGGSVTVGVNPIITGAEFQADLAVPNCTGSCVVLAHHANMWLTLAKAINPGPVPIYIRVTVDSPVNGEYWANGTAADFYSCTGSPPCADHPYDAYGQIDSTTFGTGGNVFGLGLCDIGSDSIHVGTVPPSLLIVQA